MLVTVIITWRAETLKTQQPLFIHQQESKHELSRLNLVKCLLCKLKDPSPHEKGLYFQHWGGRGRKIPGNHWPASLASLTSSKPVSRQQRQK